MAKTQVLVCDCGCGLTSTKHWESAWFTVGQLTTVGVGDYGLGRPKLNRELQFATIQCLQKWAADPTQDNVKLIG